MISCADFIAQMGDYLDGAAAAEVRFQLEAHLSHCSTCQVVYDSAKKTVRVLVDSGSFELPEAASQAVSAKIMAAIRSQRRHP